MLIVKITITSQVQRSELSARLTAPMEYFGELAPVDEVTPVSFNKAHKLLRKIKTQSIPLPHTISIALESDDEIKAFEIRMAPSQRGLRRICKSWDERAAFNMTCFKHGSSASSLTGISRLRQQLAEVLGTKSALYSSSK